MTPIQHFNDDCFNVFPSIADESIDAIICDLPYGTTQNKWDSVLDLAKLWAAYERVIKDNGAIVLFGQSLFTAKLIVSNEQLYRYSLIWEKTKSGGFLNAKRMPLQAHEDLAVFYKKLPVYNPQFQEGKPFTRKRYVSNGDGNNYGKFERKKEVIINEGKRFPRSVMNFNNGNSKTIHPTEKPVPLLEYLIRTYTNEGETVLDNCAGSFSLGEACVNTNRNCILIEKKKEYYDGGLARLGLDLT